MAQWRIVCANQDSQLSEKQLQPELDIPPSALYWMLIRVPLVLGLANCAPVLRPLITTQVPALKTSARSSTWYFSPPRTRILRTSDRSMFLFMQPRR